MMKQMKHVLITGGSDGLGKLTACKLKAAGFRVTILADKEDKLKAAAQEIGCDYVLADVSDAAAVKVAFQKAGDIDILINNAGLWIQGELEENDPDRIKRVMEVNALGPIYCTQAVIPQMKKRKTGRIINIVSGAGLNAKAERAPYHASKWALTGFTKSMQAELKSFGIAVDGLYPGAMSHTELFSAAGNTRDMSQAMDAALFADTIVYVCQLPPDIVASEFAIQSLSY